MRVGLTAVGVGVGVLGGVALWSHLTDGPGLLELGQQTASAQAARGEGVLDSTLQGLTDLVADLVAALPPWIVVMGIVAVTLGGVAIAAALARPRPAPVGSDPSSRATRRRPASSAAAAPAPPAAQPAAPPDAAKPVVPPAPAAGAPGPATVGAPAAGGSGVSAFQRAADVGQKVARSGGGVALRGARSGGGVALRGARSGGGVALRGARRAERALQARARAAAGRLARWPIVVRHRARAWWHTRRRRPVQALRFALRALGVALLRAGRVTADRGAGLARTTARDARSVSRGRGAAQAAPPPDWHAVAQRIHAEVGGEWTMLRHLADRMTTARVQADRQLLAATRPGRLAAWGLGALPVAVAAVRGWLDPAYLERLAASVPSGRVVAAAALVAAGTWWLGRRARPPFSARPSVHEAYAHERAEAAALEQALERGALYAAADVPLEEAVRRGAGDDLDGPARQLARWLTSRQAEVLTVPDSATALGRCTRALDRWLADGAPPEEALAASAARLRYEHELRVWRGPGGTLLGMLGPVLVCILPAALLLAVL